MNITDVVKVVTDAAVKIHAAIGPGCFETTYEEILYQEIYRKGLLVDRQVMMPVLYEQIVIGDAFRVDLLVDSKVVIEIIAVDKVMPVHFKKVKAYLKLLRLKNGILINFASDSMKDGIHRVVFDGGN
jgi:GxxExxY protein